MVQPITSAQDRILFRLDNDSVLLADLMKLQQTVYAMGAIITDEKEIVISLSGNGKQQVSKLMALADEIGAKAVIHASESWMIERRIGEANTKTDMLQINQGKRVQEFDDKVEVVTWFMNILDPKYAVNDSTEFAYIFPIVTKDGKRVLDLKKFEKENRQARDGKAMKTGGRMIDMMRRP